MEKLVENQATEATIQIEDSEFIKVSNYWTCDACGGDSDTGCLMSDPQDCVRG